MVQLQHLADAVDEQSVGLAARFDADCHRLLAIVAAAESETASHVYQCHDAAAQVENACYLRRRERHRGDAFRRKDVLHPQYRQAEQLAADQGGHILVETMVGFLAHAVSLSCGLYDAGLLLERRDQALAIEFRDVVVETDTAPAFDRLRRD